MKLRNLLFIATACAGLFTACSNEIEMDETSKGDNTETVAGEAYATFSFVMPSGSGAAGRSTTNVDGTSEENNITTVNFLLYNTDGKLFTNISKVRADFTPTSTNGATRYSLKEPAAIATAGTYSVHVILNPASELTAAEIGTLDAYNVYTEKVAQKTGIYCTPNKFMMTNADLVKTVAVGVTNTKTNPALITVNVERLAAKISFNNAKNNVDITGLGTVAFDAYKVINTRNSAYKLRRVGESAASYKIGAPEEPTKYVIENLFAEKASFDDTFFQTNYSRRLDTYVAFRKLKGQGIQDIAYALENTHAKTQDLKKGSITGVIFRGKVTLNENTLIGTEQANGTFYKYNGKYYTSLATMKDKLSFDFKYDEFKEEVGTGEAVDTEEKYLTLISNNKAFLYNKFGIELFAKGYAYYYYWLRHNDDSKADEAGVMEYAMVRNNVYQLRLNSVLNVGGFESGTPGPADINKPKEGQKDVENEDTEKNPEILGEVSDEQEPTTPVVPVKPTDPVFDTDMYLNVEILVNKWTVRDTPVDL